MDSLYTGAMGKKYFDEVVKNTIMNQFAVPEAGVNAQLTSREIEILRFICQSFTSKEISEKLNISLKTVETHRKNLMLKTGSTNSVALMKFAYDNQLV